MRGAKVSVEAGGVPRVLFSDSEGIVSFPLDGSRSVHLIIEAAGYEKYDRHIEPSVGSRPEDIRLNPLGPVVPTPAATQQLQNLLRNPGFEEAEDGTVLPAQWSAASYSGAAEFSLDEVVARSGARSVRIDAVAPDHARWKQRVKVKPSMLYRLTGWVRTENIGPTVEGVNKGANLAVSEPHSESQGLLGSRNWTFISLEFQSGEEQYVEIALQLGTFGGQTTGIAWFDDIRFSPVEE